VDSTGQLIGLLIGSVFLVALVAIIGGFLHYRRERLLSHAERMKALELGRELPDDAATARIKAAFGASSSGSTEEGSESLPRKVFTTALWVAFWGFLASSQGGSVNQVIAVAIAASAGAIGVTAMICGTILAMRIPTTETQRRISKPSFESDALDVVSRRG
jgi:hypothetical protein